MIRLDTSQPERYPQWKTPKGAPLAHLSCDASGRRASARVPDELTTTRDWSDPLDALEWMSNSFGVGDCTNNRWAGYFSYDLGRLFEDVPRVAADDLKFPLFEFVLWGPDDPGVERIHRKKKDFLPNPAPLSSTFTHDGYLRAVERAIEYIRAGDIFQVNMSQRFSAGLLEAPRVIYDRLRNQSPALFGALIETSQDHALICNSPEMFLHVWIDPETRARRIRTMPIKGTRPRVPQADQELLNSIKDQAELNMIIDLERNDLGRVCEFGTVRVTQPRTIESHPTLFHGVATIEGVLRDDVTFVDLLRATFPGGSITGAPKVRAMEIIEELEPVRRGPYCGAIGYLAADGSMMFNVAIRTMIVKDGTIHIPVGGGIVADSDPQAEYDETLVKARAMLDALGIRIEDLV